jgi:hypothetical protein
MNAAEKMWLLLLVQYSSAEWTQKKRLGLNSRFRKKRAASLPDNQSLPIVEVGAALDPRRAVPHCAAGHKGKQQAEQHGPL